MSNVADCVVQFQFVSAACIEAGTSLCLASEHPAAGMVRFATDHDGDPPFALFIDARGQAASVEEARTNLSNVVASSAHVVAIASNAAVGEAFEWSSYEPRDGGFYSQTFRVVPPAPAAARRTVDAASVSGIFTALDGHADYFRMRRTMEHYAEALRAQKPGGPIQAAMYLFIAVETLTDVIVARLRKTHRVSSGEELARALGLPATGTAAQVSGQIRGHVRRVEIFAEDDELHRRLKKISDGIEHGFMDFGDARDLAAITFREAASAVRRAVFRELGLDAVLMQGLLSPRYADPLPLWPLQATFEGTLVLDRSDRLADTAAAPFLDFPTRAVATSDGFDASRAATAWTLELNVDPDPDIGRVHVREWRSDGGGRVALSLDDDAGTPAGDGDT